jgi:heavy metal translocating P-type ATPase
LTGESQPIEKDPGDPVLGGTLNLDGQLVIKVSADPREAALPRLVAAVRQARGAKGDYQRLADRVSAVFLPAVMILAAATFVRWNQSAGIERGILAAMAVLLVACPCALGLATPLAVWSALGRAGQAQVLFRSGEALERLAKVRAIYFDKTGTLTDGEPCVAQLNAANGSSLEEVFGVAAGLARGSTHPLSLAIQQMAESCHVAPAALTNVRTVPGRGIIGQAHPAIGEVVLGSPKMMEQRGIACRGTLERTMSQMFDRGTPFSLVAWRGAVRGLFAFEERLRPEVSSALARLQRRGLHVEVFTGDHAARAERIARELGIPVTGELLPEEKLHAIRRGREQFGAVAMVGDGINDAPALAAADVGIAMACGADVSRDSADVCLLGNDLERIDWAIGLAKRTVKVIRQNLFWAFVYNIVGIALACQGLLNPIWTAVAMVMSGTLVVANSLRLGRSSSPADHQLPPHEGKAPTAESTVERSEPQLT